MGRVMVMRNRNGRETSIAIRSAWSNPICLGTTLVMMRARIVKIVSEVSDAKVAISELFNMNFELSHFSIVGVTSVCMMAPRVSDAAVAMT